MGRKLARVKLGNIVVVSAGPLRNDRFMAIPANVEAWLRNFSKAVRDRDYDTGRELCDPLVVAFGTVCAQATGLEQLVEEQWRTVWPEARDFDFDIDSATVLPGVTQTVVLAGWHYTELSAAGATSRRHGRATIVLQQQASTWKAIHTHFSSRPVPHENPPSGR